MLSVTAVIRYKHAYSSVTTSSVTFSSGITTNSWSENKKIPKRVFPSNFWLHRPALGNNKKKYCKKIMHSRLVIAINHMDCDWSFKK